MGESLEIKAILGSAGTSGQISQVILRRNDVIELLKGLDGLKKMLQPLLK